MEEGDFGVRVGGTGSGEGIEDTSDYLVKYTKPTDDPDIGVIKPGDVINGEIFIGELKVAKNGNVFFSVILVDHEEEEKWIISYFSPTLVVNDKVVKDIEAVEAVEQGVEGIVMYGRKGGRPYVLMDSLLSNLFNKPVGEAPYHSVVFEQFRNGVNNQVIGVEAEMLEPTHAMATSGTLRINKVQKQQ